MSQMIQMSREDFKRLDALSIQGLNRSCAGIEMREIIFRVQGEIERRDAQENAVKTAVAQIQQGFGPNVTIPLNQLQAYTSVQARLAEIEANAKAFDRAN